MIAFSAEASAPWAKGPKVLKPGPCPPVGCPAPSLSSTRRGHLQANSVFPLCRLQRPNCSPCPRRPSALEQQREFELRFQHSNSCTKALAWCVLIRNRGPLVVVRGRRTIPIVIGNTQSFTSPRKLNSPPEPFPSPLASYHPFRRLDELFIRRSHN
ncbi:hypothetical protein VTK26DRAFT_7584 [Humicola hyalothermophila]